MNPPLLRTAGIATSANFASSALKRACLLHRASRLSSCSGASRPTPWPPRQYARRYATEATQAASIDSKSVRPAKSKSRQPAAKQHTPNEKQIELLRRLDPYLPLRLRSGSYIENLAGFEGVRNPASLPGVILDINHDFAAGVLSFIALTQYRWSAYLYLAEALIEAIQPDSAEISDILQQSPWSTVDTRFPGIDYHDGHVVFSPYDPLSGTHIYGPGFELHDPSKIEQDHQIQTTSGQASTIGDIVGNQSGSTSQHDQILGHIWQSLGLITLRCREFEEDYGHYVMSHVYRVLATLHHEDKMHPQIYDSDDRTTPEAVRKPPFLHIMSSRIMANMSDAVWKAQESETIEHYELMVRAGRTTAPGWQPADVEPESILELVLWSCVHDGHIEAATTILQSMVRVTKGGSWSTVAWPILLQPEDGEEPPTTAELQDRIIQSVGEAYSPGPPMVSLPPRTVSCEVVSAVIDLIGPTEKGPLAIVNLVRKLRPLLTGTTNSNMADTFWNKTILQLLDITDLPAGGRPSYVESVGGILLDGRYDDQNYGTNGGNHNDVPELTIGSPVEAVHLRAVSAHLSLGDLAGAIRSYGRLFVSASTSSTNEAPKSHRRGLSLELPTSAIGPFIDSIIKHKKLGFGRWMIYSNDAGGPIVSEKHFASPSVQADLIRLGITLGDNDVVGRVAKHVSGTARDISPDIMSALLHAQASFHNFKNAEAVLALMRERGINASNRDVLGLACKILELQSAGIAGTKEQEVTQACKLLERVLRQEFVTPAQPYMEPDHELRRRMTQLTRVIASLGDRLAIVARKVVPVTEGSAPIESDDFNMLLDVVVKTHGPIAGKSLYNRWCKVSRPDPVSESQFSTDKYLPLVSNTNIQPGPTDACVEPSALTVQIILDPIVKRVCRSNGVKRSRQPIAVPDAIGQQTLDYVLSEQSVAHENETKDSEHVSGSLQLKRGLSLPLGPETSILKWGSQTLQEMGWTPEAIMERYPGMFEMRQDGELFPWESRA